MLEAGYTAVGEFHYLHHQRDGRPYADPAELSWAILEAQRASGIGLTHLPVLYMAGGFGGSAPEAGQRRFVHDLDRFAHLIDRLRPRFSRTRTCDLASRRTRCARFRTRRCAMPSHSRMRSTPRRRSTSTSPSR